MSDFLEDNKAPGKSNKNAPWPLREVIKRKDAIYTKIFEGNYLYMYEKRLVDSKDLKCYIIFPKTEYPDFVYNEELIPARHVFPEPWLNEFVTWEDKSQGIIPYMMFELNFPDDAEEI